MFPHVLDGISGFQAVLEVRERRCHGAVFSNAAFRLVKSMHARIH